MVDMRLEGQRFRLGTWAVSDLTSTYEIRAFAIQTDQDYLATPWVVRTRDTLPPTRARAVQALDGTWIEDGFYTFQLGFSYWTFDMAEYWNTTKLGGAASAACTVMVYNAYNTAVYLTCRTRRLTFPRDGALHAGGYRDVIVPFDTGAIIT